MRWSVASGLVLTGGTVLELTVARVADPLVLACGVGAAAALALRARWPFVAALTSLALFALPVLVSGRQVPTLGGAPASLSLTLVWLLAVYTAGAVPDVRRAVAATIPVAGLCLLYAIGPGAMKGSSGNDELAAVLFSGGVPWLAGFAVNRHRRARTVSRLAEESRNAAVEERTRIAREVHDLVSRSVSTMVVQAEAGEAVLADSPERSATFLRAVQRSGREALTELERTVQTLRSGERTRPGLDAVPDLVATARAAGLPVAVAVEPVMRRLPAAVEESAYQVVREALTNAVRHSDHAGALVRIACHADRLEVSVLDTGTAVDRRLPGGHGLRGLREVVLARGGTLTVGPTDHGQYLVHVDLPLE